MMFFIKRKEKELKKIQDLKYKIDQEQYFIDMMKGINVDLICKPNKLIDISKAYYIEKDFLKKADRIVTISEHNCQGTSIYHNTVIGKKVKIKGLLNSQINQSYCVTDSTYKYNHQSVKTSNSNYHKIVPLIEKDSFLSRYIDGIIPFEELMNFYYNEKHKTPHSIKIAENNLQQLKEIYEQLLKEKEQLKQIERHFPIDSLYLIRFQKRLSTDIERSQVYLVIEKSKPTGNINKRTREIEKECQFINFFTGVPVISFYFYNQFQYYEEKRNLSNYIEMLPLSKIIDDKIIPYSTLIEIYSECNNIEKPVFKMKYKNKK